MRTRFGMRFIAAALVLLSLFSAGCREKHKNELWWLLLLGMKTSSNEARLNALGIHEGTAFTFNPDNTGPYVSTVPKTTTDITIIAVPQSLKATVAIDGSEVTGGSFETPFADDEHTYNVLVTSESKRVMLTYQLTVRRDRNHEARLNGLEVSAGTLAPVFGEEQFAYTDNVPAGTDSIDITATLMDTAATMTIDGSPASSGVASTIDISALPADNTTQRSITVAVTAEDGTTTRNYMVALTKQCADPLDCPPSDATDVRLSTLSVQGGTAFTFNSDSTGPYETTVVRDSATVIINAVPVSNRAAVTIAGATKNGNSYEAAFTGAEEQTYEIQVVSGNGNNTRTYSLTVRRARSSEARLSNLAISAGTLTPAFVRDTRTYSAQVPHDTTTINVTPTAVDPDATLVVSSGSYSGAATSGNPVSIDVSALPADESTVQDVTVAVTAPDGTTVLYYTIHLTKEYWCQGNARLTAIGVSAGALSPAFASATYAYTVEVAEATTSFTVTPTAVCANAWITIGSDRIRSGESYTVDVSAKPQLITMMVEEPSGGTQAYTINVIEGGYTEARLNSLATSVGSLSPAFGAEVLNYNNPVPYGTTSINVTAVTMNAAATMTIDGVAATSGVASTVSLSTPTKDIVVNVQAEDGTTHRIYVIHVTTGPDPENRLTNLTVSAGTLNPAFNSDTNGYSVQVPYGSTSIDVTATVMSANATIAIDGTSATSGTARTVSLPDPTRTVNIVVTAQNGSTRTYSIAVTKAGDPENRLSNLVVSQGTLSPSFATGTLNYADVVPFGTTSMTVTATTTSANATLTIAGAAATSGSAATVSLPDPTRTVNIVVTAQDGTARTYSIAVSKAQDPENHLSNLQVSAGTLNPIFTSNTQTYSDVVPFGTTSMTVTATTTSTSSTLTVNGAAATSGSATTVSLPDPTRTISIVVTAQNGTTRTYTINVSKGLDPDNNLSGLSVSAGSLSPVFAAGTLNYSDQVPYGTASMTVTATTASANATLTVNGAAATSGAAVTVSLPDPTRTISIVVTSQSGASRTYSIAVSKALDPENHLSNLAVSIGTLSPAFAAGTQNYADIVPYGTTSMTVTATTTSANATLTIDGSPATSGVASTVSLPGATKTINVVVIAQDNTTRTYAIDVTKTLDPENRLSNLAVSLGTLSPAFATGTQNYADIVPYGTTSMTVTATTTSANATLTIAGAAATSGSATTVSLPNPTRTISIVVTAQDGTTRTYSIDVSKAQDSENRLSNLAVSLGTLSPAFASGTQAYTDVVPFGTTSMTVTATVTSANATLTVNGAAATSGAAVTVSLPDPTRTISIVVTAQDGTTRTYTIDVSKGMDPENHLSNLVVSQGTLSPAFAANTQSYSDIVPYGTTSMTVTATTLSGTATLAIDGAAATSGSAVTVNLPDPTRNINIVVTAQSGATRTYTIAVSKAQDPENHLSNLAVSLGTLSPAFATGTLSYADVVPFGTTSMTVTATTTSANATLTIDGAAATSGAAVTVSLPDPTRTINIVVRAQDSTTRTYSITVSKAGDPENHLSNLAVSLGTLSPAFASGTQSYSDVVPYGATSMNVTATTTSANATLTINGSAATSGTPFSVNVSAASGTISIVVRAQDNTTRTYTIDFAHALDPENHLSNLAVSLGTLSPAFATGTQSYSDIVPYGTTSMTVTATTASANATLTINGAAATSGSAVTVSLPDPTRTITIVVRAQDSTTRTYSIDVSKGQDPENHLSNLVVSQGTLSPAFATGTLSYADVVPFGTTSMTVTATTTSANATLTIDGAAATSGAATTVSLPDTTRTISIVVRAQDSTTRTYTINVSKAGDPENRLSNLAVSLGTLSPAFASGTQSYSDIVPYGTTSMTVTATTASANATLTINGAAATSGSAVTVSLPDPTRTINIVVTAQDGTTRTINIVVTSQSGVTRTYTIAVSKTQDPENRLSNLAVSLGTLSPAFAMGTQSYADVVPFGTTSMTVTATTTSANATLTIDGAAATSGVASTVGLPDPTRTINIVVTAQDGTTRTYSIAVTKAQDPENHLSNLAVSVGTLSPAFASGTQSYSDTLPFGTTSIAVTATTASANATLTINGSPATSGTARTVNLSGSSGSISIVVRAQDSTTRTYVINWAVAQDSENRLSALAVSIGTLSPAFASGTQSYSVQLPSGTPSIDVTATAMSGNATLAINGSAATSGVARTVSLSGASGTISIVVTAQNTTTRIYAINWVTVGDTENRLSAMTVSAGSLSPSFASGTYTYSESVSYCTSSIVVTATAMSSNATMTINGVSVVSGSARSVDVSGGSTGSIAIVVTPQSGSAATYTINWAKGSAPNVNLSGITNVITGTTCSNPLYRGGFNYDYVNKGFLASETTYGVVIQGRNTGTAHYTEDIDIGATLADPSNATMTIDGVSVASGGTRTVTITMGGYSTSGTWTGAGNVRDVPIVVTSNDGCATRTYTVRLRLLNIYEMYYGGILLNSEYERLSWGVPPVGTLNWTKNGAAGGTLNWRITISFVSGSSTQTFTNYNPDNIAVCTNTVPSASPAGVCFNYRVPYTDGAASTNGTVTGSLNMSKNGTFTSTGLTMTHPSGVQLCTFTVNLTITAGSPVEGTNSYYNVTYMGLTRRLMYRAISSSTGRTAHPYDLHMGNGGTTREWDPATPWTYTQFPTGTATP